MLFKAIFIVSVSIISTALYAVPMPPVPTAPLYIEPDTIEASHEIKQQSCIQIDNAIRHLQPYQYSYKPGFFEDGYNKIATDAIIFDFLPINGLAGFAYLSYSGLVEDKEQRRIIGVKQQIAMLRQVKAEKHCFE